MKKNLVKVVLLFCLSTLSFSQEENATIQNIDNNISIQAAKSIFLSYENIPKKVYVGEIFPIKIKTIIANNDFDELSTNLEENLNLKILNKDSKWQWLSDNVFFNTYYFKATFLDAKLPKITLNLIKDSNIIDSQSLNAASTEIIQLNGTKYFSNVIATTLDVKKYKTSQFDDKNLIIVLQIEAEYANLSDFSLKWVNKDGIDTQINNLPFFKIYYYAIIPNFTKNFTFSYFNSVKNKFIKITLPIVVSDDQVSTQSDLNPQDSGLQLYKYGTVAFFSLLLITFYLKRKKIVYIIFLILILVVFIYDLNPFNNIRLEKNTKVQILPTKKSTIFYVTNRPLYATKLETYKHYIKILLTNGKIGWIKDTSVSKN